MLGYNFLIPHCINVFERAGVIPMGIYCHYVAGAYLFGSADLLRYSLTLHCLSYSTKVTSDAPLLFINTMIGQLNRSPWLQNVDFDRETRLSKWTLKSMGLTISWCFTKQFSVHTCIELFCTVLYCTVLYCTALSIASQGT